LLSESDNARRFKVEDSTASRRAVDPATRSNLLVAAALVLLLANSPGVIGEIFSCYLLGAFFRGHDYNNCDVAQRRTNG
jgi:hypothetical protein